MFVAILLACSIAVPADCVRHEMVILTPMPTTAFVEAQARAGQWLADHPGLVQRKLTLRAGRAA